jgi:hypothetical protein
MYGDGKETGRKGELNESPLSKCGFATVPSFLVVPPRADKILITSLSSNFVFISEIEVI